MVTGNDNSFTIPEFLWFGSFSLPSLPQFTSPTQVTETHWVKGENYIVSVHACMPASTQPLSSWEQSRIQRPEHSTVWTEPWERQRMGRGVQRTPAVTVQISEEYAYIWFYCILFSIHRPSMDPRCAVFFHCRIQH